MDQSIDARTHPGLGRGARGRERETHDGRRRGEASGYGNLKLQSGPRRVRDRAGRSSCRVMRRRRRRGTRSRGAARDLGI